MTIDVPHNNHSTIDDLLGQASQLCLSCGLCCQGVFFFHDNDPQSYGVEIDRQGQNGRTEDLPLCCPLLHRQGYCLIHDHPQRPFMCKDYQCQLLKGLLNNQISLDRAQTVVREIKRLMANLQRIIEIDSSKPFFDLLADGKNLRFRQCIEQNNSNTIFLDIASFTTLVSRYILPFVGGFVAQTCLT